MFSRDCVSWWCGCVSVCVFCFGCGCVSVCFLPVILWWSLCVCAFVYGVFAPDDDGTKQTNSKQ